MGYSSVGSGWGLPHPQMGIVVRGGRGDPVTEFAMALRDAQARYASKVDLNRQPQGDVVSQVRKRIQVRVDARGIHAAGAAYKQSVVFHFSIPLYRCGPESLDEVLGRLCR